MNNYNKCYKILVFLFKVYRKTNLKKPKKVPGTFFTMVPGTFWCLILLPSTFYIYLMPDDENQNIPHFSTVVNRPILMQIKKF